MTTLARLTPIAFVLLLCGSWPIPGIAGQTNSFAVTSVRVFDGDRILPAATIVVRDGLIAAIADAAPVPDGVPVIDGSGHTLLPGLIDSHVHVSPGAREDALRFGVTTLLDMYHLGPPEAAASFRSERESLARTRAADVFSAMAGVTPPGGHPTQLARQMGIEIPTLGPDQEAREYVRARVEDGADYIKIIQDDSQLGETRLAKFDGDRLAEIIAAAHSEDRLAIVHVSAHDEALLALERGADVLAHVFQDRVADERLVTTAAERNAAVVPTLSVLASAAGSAHAGELAAHPRLGDRLSSMQRASLTARFGRERPELLEDALESVRRLHAAGVDILAGTDAPNPGTAHGVSMHQELELLVAAGLEPADALRAATAMPAARFGLDDRGRIVPGLRADLLLVAGDPTDTITRTREIAAVWKNGYPVDTALSAGNQSEAAAQAHPADAFLARLAEHCGEAFAGRVVTDEPTTDDDPFTGKALIMHVRRCTDDEIRVPFHVGDDRSRTWVITRTESGLRLKHDHRHEDGSEDVITWYGGDTTTGGDPMRQEFPVDAESIELFEREGLHVSTSNVWALEIEPGERFLYELARPGGRLFQVEFDLTKPVSTPPAPWR